MGGKKSFGFFIGLYILLFAITYSPQLLRNTPFFSGNTSYLIAVIDFNYIAIIGIAITSLLAVIIMYRIMLINTIEKKRLIVIEVILCILIALFYFIATENMFIRISFHPILVLMGFTIAFGLLSSFVVSCFRISCYVTMKDSQIEYIPSDD